MLAINMDDVINVLNSCKPYLIFFGVVLALAVIVMIACKKLGKAKRKLVRAEAGELCTAVAEEGIVLLKNDDNLLPFNQNMKLNVFGWSSLYRKMNRGGDEDEDNVFVQLPDFLSGAHSV